MWRCETVVVVSWRCVGGMVLVLGIQPVGLMISMDSRQVWIKSDHREEGVFKKSFKKMSWLEATPSSRNQNHTRKPAPVVAGVGL